MKAIVKYWPHAFVLVMIAMLIYFCNDPASPVATPNNSGKQAVLHQPKSYVDTKTGTVHTETKVAQANQDQLQHAYYKRMLDDLKKQLDLKEKQIERLTAASSYTEGNAVLKRDTVYLPSKDADSADNGLSLAVDRSYWTYADKWMYMRGELVGDSLSIDYRTNDSIALVTYWKRRGWFGKRELYINGFSMNPKSKIVGLQSVKVDAASKPLKWGVGLHAGFGITAGGLSPYIGIGLNRNFIRF